MNELLPDAGPDRDPSCPVCEAARSPLFALAPDRLFGIAAGTFRLYRCSCCGCVFQSPFPDPDTLSTWYPKPYWWTESRGSGLAGFLGRLERTYREFVAMDHVRFLERHASGAGAGRTLLDIGCSSGTFLHLARRRGFLPHGIDVSPQAVEAARRQYDLPVRQGDVASDAWEGRTFDFVTMFHVLEHLPDPCAALSCAGAMLKPGGSLILQVPNVSSCQARIFGTRWYGLDVPRHLVNFTPQGLRHLLDRAGLSCRIVRRFSLRDNPASLASSLAPALDPIGRKGRGKSMGAAVEGALELCYFGLFLLALPPAFLEAAVGRGGTIWAHAQRPPAPG